MHWPPICTPTLSPLRESRVSPREYLCNVRTDRAEEEIPGQSERRDLRIGELAQSVIHSDNTPSGSRLLRYNLLELSNYREKVGGREGGTTIARGGGNDLASPTLLRISFMRLQRFLKTLRNLWRNDHFAKLNSRCDSSQGEGGAWSEKRVP